MKVKIKTWKRMAEEGEPIGQDAINIGLDTFVTNMEEALPEDRVIDIEKDGKNWYWYAEAMDWMIDPKMIEKIYDDFPTFDQIALKVGYLTQRESEIGEMT